MSNEPSAPEPYQLAPGAILTLAGEVPDGWECRSVSDRDWWSPYGLFAPCLIVEARPIPKPPLMVEIDRDAVDRFLACNFGSYAAPIVEAIRAALAAESES